MFGAKLGVKPPGLGRTLTFYSCFQASHYKPHGSAPHVGVFQFYSITKLLTSSAHITPSALVRLKSSCGMLSGYEEPNLHDLAFLLFQCWHFSREAAHDEGQDGISEEITSLTKERFAHVRAHAPHAHAVCVFPDRGRVKSANWSHEESADVCIMNKCQITKQRFFIFI